MTDVILGQCSAERYRLLNSSDHENSDATTNKTKQKITEITRPQEERKKEICVQYLPLRLENK
jgi:hypothetical protein